MTTAAIIMIAFGIGAIGLVVLSIIYLIIDTWCKVDDIHEKLIRDKKGK